MSDLRQAVLATRERGGIFLVSGTYGAGKTSLLNALKASLPDGTNQYVYEDLALCKTTDLLAAKFKQIGEQASSIRKNGRRPILGMDQLHILDTKHVEEFFRDRQVAFEQWKKQGVILVFAGNDRFASLVKTAGPLGAIFDDQFDLVSFDEQLAREMIEKRCLAVALDKDAFRFPFTSEAVREIVRAGKGNPRNVLELAKSVLKYAKDKTKPIVIQKVDVIAATAELSAENLQKVRDELRSPNMANALAKLVKLHEKPNGPATLHELGRLLDLALGDPSTALAEHAKTLLDPAMRPDLVVEAAATAGLTETTQERRKTSYGSVNDVIHFLSKNAVTVLARLRDSLGLLPSSYLARISREYTVEVGHSGHDLIAADLREIYDSVSSPRAKTFIDRALKSYRTLIEGHLDERACIDLASNTIKGISLELKNEVPTSFLSGTAGLGALLLTPGEQEKLQGAAERLDELRVLFDDRGTNWSEVQFADARTAYQALARLLLPTALSSAKNRTPSPENYSQELHGLLESLRSWRRPNPSASTSAPQQFVDLTIKVHPDMGRMTLLESLLLIDSASYENGVDNEPQGISVNLVEVATRLAADTAWKELDKTMRSGTSLFNHLVQQVPNILSPGHGVQSLGKSVRAMMDAPAASKLFERLSPLKFDALEHQELTKELGFVVPRLRQATEASTYAQLSAAFWYMLRNYAAHNAAPFNFMQYQLDLHKSFLAAISLVVNRISTTAGFTLPAVGQIQSVADDHSVLLDQDGQLLVALPNSVKPQLGEVWIARKARPGSKLARLVRHFPFERKALLPDELALIPTNLSMALLSLEAAPETYPRWRETIQVFHARTGNHGTTVCDYGRPRATTPVGLPPSLDSNTELRNWIQELGEERALFIGWVFPAGTSQPVVVPIYAGLKDPLLRTVANQITTRRSSSARDAVSR